MFQTNVETSIIGTSLINPALAIPQVRGWPSDFYSQFKQYNINLINLSKHFISSYKWKV